MLATHRCQEASAADLIADDVPSLARRQENAFPSAMNRDEQVLGLQRILLNERARLLRFLVARGAGEEGEDLLQELWERVISIPSHPIADPVPYLFRAAENLLRDRRRSNMSRERRQHAWYEVSPAAQEEPSGDRALIARQRLRNVEAVLAELGPRVDRVFRRYRMDGAGQATIASELGISLSSVEKDLQKAYRALAELKAQFDAE